MTFIRSVKITRSIKSKIPCNVLSYAIWKDNVMLVLAILSAFLQSAAHRAIIIIYSELVGMFIDRTSGIGISSNTYFLPLLGGGRKLKNATIEENMQELKHDSIAYIILVGISALILLISGIVYVDLFNRVALRLVTHLRSNYFKAIIRQDMTWHDTATNQNFALRLTDNMEKIRNAIGENLGHCLKLLFDITLSTAISFFYDLKLALVFAVLNVTLVVICFLGSKFESKYMVEEQNAYVNASNVVEESIAAIRTVVAFNGEEIEAARYEDQLRSGLKAGKLKRLFSSFSQALVQLTLFTYIGGAFWYGGNQIVASRQNTDEPAYTSINMIIVIMSVSTGLTSITRILPFLNNIAEAQSSAKVIFELINLVPKIDSLSTEGLKRSAGLRGDIVFENVTFNYPSRQDVTALSGFNLQIKRGETLAVVGYSGCGKSTCLQLLQRFYDPQYGRILIDNEDIRKYNVGWLRKNLASVGQEPVLFHGSIGENIRHGKMHATLNEVEEAATAAGVHEFIKSLSHGYDTLIGEKGVQLSGGQRQRIAIARALIQNPSILLLDEATAALDYHSEMLVQDALDKASIGRTTIVVSHRLSAVYKADRIAVIDQGEIVEQGTHKELLQLGGKYAQLVKAQELDLNLTTERDKNGFDPMKANYENEIKYKDIHGVYNTNGEISVPTSYPKLEYSYISVFCRIIASTKPEWLSLIFCFFCAAICGCSSHAIAILNSSATAALALPNDKDLLQNIAEIAIACVVIGVIFSIAHFSKTYLSNWAGVYFSARLRSQTFRSILSQEVGWFEEEEQSVGSLSARLSGNAASVQAAFGVPINRIMQAISNFIASFTIAFMYSLKLALISCATAPFMVGSIIFEAYFTKKSIMKEKEILENTSRIATESLAQIRTVAALNRESELIDLYDESLKRYMIDITKRLRYRGIIHSLGISILFLGYSATMGYGGIMVSNREIHFEHVQRVANTLLFGLFILSQHAAFAPMVNGAVASAHRLYEIIDRKPKIQSSKCSALNSKSEQHITEMDLKASYRCEDVTYKNVNFSYPMRPEQRVLRNFKLSVPRGKVIALVGPSGSGKSTCLQLLQRYYDPNSGEIFINQYNIERDLSLPLLRSRLGLVSQETSLFEKSIAENIAYGDTSRIVPMPEIVDAAKMANAHDFISALPHGYETKVGSRGTQLSGGQKQRIAIARALVRNPRILLLDEATSALDLQSERTVQAALDVACSTRTCIVVAHRLSTIQNADIICVMQGGRIVESGSHSELLNQNDGIYAKLYRCQAKS